MSVNQAVEGRTYRMPGTHVVTASEIAAFCAAVRSPADNSGERQRSAPPTFAVTIAQRAEAEFMHDPEAGVDYSRLVHGEESFVYHAPIVPGDELVAQTCVKRVRSAGGHDMVTLETVVATEAGALRTTATSVVVIRGEGDSK